MKTLPALRMCRNSYLNPAEPFLVVPKHTLAYMTSNGKTRLRLKQYSLKNTEQAGNNLKGRLQGCLVLLFILFVLPMQSLAAQPVKEYQFRIINSFAHSRHVFTQGLEFHNNLLYESAGLYGHSKVFTRTLDSLTPIHHQRLSKTLFGEGITLLNHQLFQLTWQSGRMFIYKADTLEPRGEVVITGEGWGLTNNGKHLIFSNGSDQLTFLEPSTATVIKTLDVTFQGKPLQRLNELEWINGVIYANIWQSHWIVMIDPNSGAVIGKVNLSNLLPKNLRTTSTDVLNGIAYDRDKKRLFVTGKNWPKLYHIELSLLPTPAKLPLKTQR